VDEHHVAAFAARQRERQRRAAETGRSEEDLLAEEIRAGDARVVATSGSTLPLTVGKLKAKRAAYDSLDPTTKAKIEAESQATLKATLDRLNSELERINIDLNALPSRERERIAPLGDETPLWHLFRKRAVLRRAAENAQRPALDTSLLTRALHQRPRERRERRTSRTVSSRGDPSPDDDLDHLSPLQAGFLAFLEALVAAARGGAESYAAFLDLVARRIAAEAGRLLEEGDR
jgi:hypothetical protein